MRTRRELRPKPKTETSGSPMSGSWSEHDTSDYRGEVARSILELGKATFTNYEIVYNLQTPERETMECVSIMVP